MSDKERAQRYRRRKELGLRVFAVELDNYQLSQLIDAGFVSPDAVDDKDRIGDQIGFAIEALLAGHNVTDI